MSWTSSEFMQILYDEDEVVADEVDRRFVCDVWGRRRRRGDRCEEDFMSDDQVPDDLRGVRNKFKRMKVVGNADEGDDAALFPGEETAQHFKWCRMDSFQGRREDFLPSKTGPTVATASAYEAFSQFWDEAILTHIVSETNRYAATLSFAGDWYNTNTHEILILFCFWIMLGVIQMPTLKSCFTQHPLLEAPCFRLMFTRRRYEHLCSALHFNDDSLRTPSSSELFPIEPILTHLNARFQSAYIPRQEICIDVSLTLWKEKTSFSKYIKSKSSKLGMKTFELCESSTGYLWSFFVYNGGDSLPNSSFPASLLKSTACVLQLIKPLLNKGYSLFIDNWYSNPLLARFLKRNHTDVVGSIGLNQSNVPTTVSVCKLPEGQVVARHSGDMTIMGYQDKRKIGFISTYHGTEMAQAPWKGPRIALSKPKLVLDYNKFGGGMHLKECFLESDLVDQKKCAQWDLNLFKSLLNSSILNSRICFEASKGVRKDRLSFRVDLVDEILKNHLNLVPKSPIQAPQAEMESRFTAGQHFPKFNRKCTKSGRTKRLKCRQCGKRSTFKCETCDVGFCIDPCFERYHTLD